MQYSDYPAEGPGEGEDFAEIPSFRAQDFDDFDGEEGSILSEGSDERPLEEEAALPAKETTRQHTPYVAVPELVKQFVSYFYRHIKERNVYDIQGMYETGFNKITEKYFKQSPWPMAESIAPLVQHDPLFLVLYKELYFRHIYSKMNPTLEQRFDSWKNYCDLFNYLLNSNPQDLHLPIQWLWDITDEFIYQFQSFSQYRSKLKTKSGEELNALKNNPQVWNVTTVITILQSLISKSNIVAVLQKEKGESPANHTLLQLIGYFSIIGLLRVHCLLGDYYLAAKTIEPIDLQNKQGLFSQVPACHITLYYYIGFVYLMMRRYVDAVKIFSSVLVFISRTKQYHSRSYQYENLMKKNEQMYGLLAICLSLCPQRVDESVHALLREKYSDKMTKMQKGDETVYEELFTAACPKFINAASPNYTLLLEDPSKYPALNYNQEAVKLQTKLFLSEVKQQSLLPTIRSYLKLYTTIGTQKLADFLETDQKTFRTQLLCYKHKTRGLVWNGGSPLNGEMASYSDVDFFLEKDMVHINDTKTQRRYSEFFIRHTEKLLNLSSRYSQPTPTE